MHTHRRFVWHDLMSSDRPASVAFFTQLMGWKTRDEDPKTADYVHFLHDGVDLAGAPRHQDPNAPHRRVRDQAAERFCFFGLRVDVRDREVIPGVGRFSVMKDPAGVHFALFKGAPS